MSASEDVSNLFRRFGGEAEDYQELSRENQAAESRARWPLLSSVHLQTHAMAPSVNEGVASEVAGNVPSLQGRQSGVNVSPFAPPPDASAAAVPPLGPRDSLDPIPAALTRNARPRSGTLGDTLFKPRAAASRSAASASSPPRAADIAARAARVSADISRAQTLAGSDASEASLPSAGSDASSVSEPRQVAMPRRSAPRDHDQSVTRHAHGRSPVATGLGGLGGLGDIRGGIQSEKLSRAGGAASVFHSFVERSGRRLATAPDDAATASPATAPHAPWAMSFAASAPSASPAHGAAPTHSAAPPLARSRDASDTGGPAASGSPTLASVFSRLAGEAPTKPQAVPGNALLARLSRL